MTAEEWFRQKNPPPNFEYRTGAGDPSCLGCRYVGGSSHLGRGISVGWLAPEETVLCARDSALDALTVLPSELVSRQLRLSL